MLALKKKREAEKKEAEEREEAAKRDNGGSTAPAAPAGQVSLFGIGGEKKTKKGETPGKKRSPGEIRIQKGKFSILKFCQILIHGMSSLSPQLANKTSPSLMVAK